MRFSIEGETGFGDGGVSPDERIMPQKQPSIFADKLLVDTVTITEVPYAGTEEPVEITRHTPSEARTNLPA